MNTIGVGRAKTIFMELTKPATCGISAIAGEKAGQYSSRNLMIEIFAFS
jgi:hypothetical protein